MKRMNTLCILVSLPCWIGCQLSLSTTDFIEDSSLNISQCTNTNLVFSQLTISLITCASVCAADASCAALVYIPAEMTCKGCGPLNTTGVPNPSDEIIIYSRVKKYCDSGWIQFQDNCYWITYWPGGSGFTANAQKCEQNDSRLVHIDTAEENDFLTDRVHAMLNGAMDCAYIGLTITSYGGNWTFHDTKDPMTFCDFKPNQCIPYWPDNIWRCSAFYVGVTDRWVDLPCSNNCMSICEKKV